MTSKTKKALKITGNVLTVAVAILVVIMTVLTVFSMVFNRDGTASVFGVQAYVVQSDSMTPEFAAGDVIFSEEVNPRRTCCGRHNHLHFARQRKLRTDNNPLHTRGHNV